MKRYRWPLLGIGGIALLIGFLLFRPDKLFVNDVTDESLADIFPVTSQAPSSTAPTTTTTSAQAPVDGNETTTTITTTTTTPARPTVIGSGGFYGIDHSAAGTATIYEQDGTFVLRFEDDTDIQNGPDLFVWVLEADSYPGGDPGDVIDLGKLKGNIGGQNYVLPAGYDPNIHQFALVWCKRFSVPFAGAPLN